MPFVIPSADVGAESLILDGLDLAEGPLGMIMLAEFTPPLFKKRYEWIEGADSDGALLARDPLVSIGQAVIKLAINGVNRDDAQTIIGGIIDKLEEADRNPGGIPLVWTPAESSVSGTCYVLTGEVTEFPVDWESGYMANHPMVTITLECAPGWYLDPITVTGSATAGPLVTLDLPSVPGDVPADGTLKITDASSQSRRTVEWGAEQRHYDPGAPWSLVLDSDSLVTSGFAGTQTTLAGAYDPGASGNAIIVNTLVSSYQAICGTGAQPHIGTFRVKVRINTGPAGCTGVSFRLAWRAGDGIYTTNDPVTVTDATQEFLELDLGLVTVPQANTGTQAWDARIEAAAPGTDTLYVDYLMLIPVDAGYGKATASYGYAPGVIVARDAFTGIVAASVLNTRTPDAGAAWATAGVATDFVGNSSDAVQRTTGSVEATPRLGVLGGAMADQEVAANITAVKLGPGTSWRATGLLARYVDSSNYLRLRLRLVSATVQYLEIVKVIAGVETIIAQTSTGVAGGTDGDYRLIVFASGRAIGTVTTASTVYTAEVSDATLVTAGTLASGKGGIADQSLGTAGIVRTYDDVLVSTPTTEPIVLYSGRSLEIRHDSTERESSGGGTWGRPASYRGGRFRVNPAGDQDRTTRVAVKASRNDLATAADDNLTDQITLVATITPRCSVIPRV